MRTFALLVLAVLMSCGPSPAQQVGSAEYDHMLSLLLDGDVPTTDVAAMSTASGIILLDARAKKEYEVSHVATARWVGYDEFDLTSVRDIPKDASIVVYCSVGYRSEKVTQQLRDAGWKNVRNLYGGIFEWVNAGRTVVNEKGPTEQIHGYDAVWSVWLKRGEIVL